MSYTQDGYIVTDTALENDWQELAACIQILPNARDSAWMRYELIWDRNRLNAQKQNKHFKAVKFRVTVERI